MSDGVVGRVGELMYYGSFRAHCFSVEAEVSIKYQSWEV